MREDKHTVPIDKLIAHWVKSYEFFDGESLHGYEARYDPIAKKVVFRLYINDKGVTDDVV